MTATTTGARTRFWSLDGDPDDVVLRTPGGVLRRAELVERVEERAAEIGRGRLVLLSGGNYEDLAVTYLACLRAGSPVILGGPDGSAELAAAYDPDVVVRTGPDTPAEVETRRHVTVHDLHPDLALLLSTSGSTGSPKLVRLSGENLDSNARAIADYLGLTPCDVAVTSLPLHYCYGLSVLNSHLAAGAGVSLTHLSVVDPCFRDRARADGVTNLAGVPFTFELLERDGFRTLEVPSLRFVTQAGGRMPPERVRRVAEVARRHGVQLFVMYGQTEATARMAYLPPALAESRPSAVGIPIPGGELEIRPLPAEEADRWPADAGEVVYRGPNVMMGYAEGPGELGAGPELDELRTGDVGRRADDGLIELVGRRSRFVKLYGLRLDLDRLERLLADDGVEALCVGDDEGVLVGTTHGDPDGVAAAAASHLGVPARMVDVVTLAELPRDDRGKPDRRGLRQRLAARGAPATPTVETDGVAAVYRRVLGTDHVTGRDTFVSAGGDSLSYVEAALHLEELLGTLPEAWHLRSVDELEALRRAGGRRRWGRVLETGVVLRALAVVLVVGNHMDLYRVPGGAHVLLAVAGFNLARFSLDTGRGPGGWWERFRPVARVAVPTSLWVLLTLLVAGGTSLGATLLVNNYVGSPTLEDERWRYWFVEVLVQLLVLTTLLVSVPAVRRFERRRPFLLPALLLVPALLLRWGAPLVDDSPRYAFRTHHVAWVFLLGWAASRARTTGQKVLVSAMTVLACAGFFDDPLRDGVLAAGLLALTWVDRIRVPRAAAPVLSAVAAASLYVYLTHYEVFPPLQRVLPDVVALVLTVAVGVVVARAVARAGPWLRAARRTGAAQRAREKVASSRSDSAPTARAPTA